MAYVNCSKCSRLQPAKASFCEHCGHPIPRPPYAAKRVEGERGRESDRQEAAVALEDAILECERILTNPTGMYHGWIHLSGSKYGCGYWAYAILNPSEDSAPELGRTMTKLHYAETPLAAASDLLQTLREWEAEGRPFRTWKEDAAHDALRADEFAKKKQHYEGAGVRPFAEKRGDSRNSGVDVPVPTTTEDAPTQEPATTETPTSTPATPSTQETALVERLKELVTVWRGQSEEGHNYRMVSTVYRDVADELEETLRATTHPEKTKDES